MLSRRAAESEYRSRGVFIDRALAESYTDQIPVYVIDTRSFSRYFRAANKNSLRKSVSGVKIFAVKSFAGSTFRRVYLKNLRRDYEN